MSSPNRNKVLLGFGGLAVIVVAAIAFWPPNFRSEEASGAIGVVQKHHAPQIAQQDVILGDEKTREQQSVLYRDYFDHAAKLQALSAELASRDAVAANRDASALASAMQTEYASQFAAALAQAEMAAKAAGNMELAQRCEELAAREKGMKELSLASMQELNSQLASIAQAESKTAARIILQSAEASLQSALASRGEEAASKLQAATAELQSMDLASIEMADRVEYLQHAAEALGIILQNGKLGIILQSRDGAQMASAAQELANQADALANAALQNVQEQTMASISMASMLQHMQTEAAASKMQSAQLASFDQALSAFSEQFASRAQSAFQAELASMSEFAASRAQYSKLANAKLEASMVGNQEMASKLYAQLANTAELQHAAANIGEAMQNQALASALANESQLASQAAELASRAH